MITADKNHFNIRNDISIIYSDSNYPIDYQVNVSDEVTLHCEDVRIVVIIDSIDSGIFNGKILHFDKIESKNGNIPTNFKDMNPNDIITFYEKNIFTCTKKT